MMHYAHPRTFCFVVCEVMERRRVQITRVTDAFGHTVLRANDVMARESVTGANIAEAFIKLCVEYAKRLRLAVCYDKPEPGAMDPDTEPVRPSDFDFAPNGGKMDDDFSTFFKDLHRQAAQSFNIPKSYYAHGPEARQSEAKRRTWNGIPMDGTDVAAYNELPQYQFHAHMKKKNPTHPFFKKPNPPGTHVDGGMFY